MYATNTTDVTTNVTNGSVTQVAEVGRMEEDLARNCSHLICNGERLFIHRDDRRPGSAYSDVRPLKNQTIEFYRDTSDSRGPKAVNWCIIGRVLEVSETRTTYRAPVRPTNFRDSRRW